MTTQEIALISYCIQTHPDLWMFDLYEKIFDEGHIKYADGHLFFYLNEDVNTTSPQVRQSYQAKVESLSYFLKANIGVKFILKQSQIRPIREGKGSFLIAKSQLPKEVSQIIELALCNMISCRL